MKIVVNSIIPFKGYTAMALWPFIFVRKGIKITDTLIRHEQIHLRQQKELLIIGFLLLYLVFWLWWSVRLRSFHDGYRACAFEREAYFFEGDGDYLNRRPFWAWKHWV